MHRGSLFFAVFLKIISQMFDGFKEKCYLCRRNEEINDSYSQAGHGLCVATVIQYTLYLWLVLKECPPDARALFMIMKPTDDDDWIPQRGGGDDRSNGGTVIHPQSRG